MRRFRNILINLKDFQKEAVESLLKNVNHLINNNTKNNICVFQSPTGSGKTVMMGQLIRELIDENNNVDLCFLWVSIGKGQLHVQSKNKLEAMFGGFPVCSLVESEFTGYREEINNNEIVFVNWEKLRSKDKLTNEWSNTLMKDGDKISFPEVLSNTINKRKIIMIIDESHYANDTERANELKELINADVLINMSATPNYIPNAREIQLGSAAYVSVEPSRVIEEGMIKKEVIINQSLNELVKEDLSSQNAVVLAAINKRNKLSKLYAQEKSDVNPLVLIQLPNADLGNEKLEQIKSILSSKNISEENGKLGIWISEYKSKGIENLTNINNEIEFLIFKQAIDTGWDCPRAQILIKLREIQSSTFEIQTIGRILRMPEQQHYTLNEDLNKAYIYTNLENIIVKPEEYNPNIIKRWKSHIKDEINAELEIESYYKARVDYGSIMADFQTYFIEECLNSFTIEKDSIDYLNNIDLLKSHNINFSLELDKEQLFSDYIIESTIIDEGFETFNSVDKVDFVIDDRDIQNYFEKLIKDNTGSYAPKRSLSSVKTSIYRFFKEYLGSNEWEQEIKSIQIIFIKNHMKFIPIILGAIDKYKIGTARKFDNISEDIVNKNYSLPTELYYNEHTVEKIGKHKKYAHDICYLNINRSNPEKDFEEYIDNNETVKWWFKNGEKKQDFLGIKYKYEGTVHTFYPDYIIKTDDNIGILEVKVKGDRDGHTKTKAKSDSLQKYIKAMNNKPNLKYKIFGGIVIEHNNEWMINTSDDIDWSLVNNNNFIEWAKLDKIIKEH